MDTNTNTPVSQFTPRQLLSKTMPFVWAKLFLRLIAAALVTGLLALGIFIAARSPMAGVGIIIGTVLISSGIYFIIVQVFGYAARVGHIAVLAETIKTGQVPDNQMQYGASMVKSRLASAAVFFAINRLVDRAVQQLQRALTSVVGVFGVMPGVGGLLKFGQSIVKISLKYVDECCIAWIFYGPSEQSAWKGALDGVTIYAQNWKRVLKDAFKTALWVLLMTALVAIALILIFGGLFNLVGSPSGSGWGLLAWFFGILAALAIKRAFIDSWIMIRMLVMFLDVAPKTQIRLDIYGKLCSMSPAFRKMTQKARADIDGDPFSAPPLETPMSPFPQQQMTNSPPMQAQTASQVFCGQCGAKNQAGSAFCNDCGQRI